MPRVPLLQRTAQRAPLAIAVSGVRQSVFVLHPLIRATRRVM